MAKGKRPSQRGPGAGRTCPDGYLGVVRHVCRAVVFKPRGSLLLHGPRRCGTHAWHPHRWSAGGGHLHGVGCGMGQGAIVQRSGGEAGGAKWLYRQGIA